MAADDYALVVGIANYPGLQSLEGPLNDARAFYDWVISPDGGAVPEENAFLILSDEASGEEGLDEAENARPVFDDLDRILRQNIIIKAVKQDYYLGRRLYLYFSGHGYAQKIDEVSLIMANSNNIAGIIGYPGSIAASNLRSTGIFDEIVLLMDCCRDNYPTPIPRLPGWQLRPDASGAKVKYFYAYATQWFKKARETGTEEGEYHGLFTRALLKGLRQGMADDNQTLTGRRLKQIVKEYLLNDPENKHRQEPEIRLDEELDIVFREGFVEPDFEIRINLPPSATGEIVISDGGETEFARKSADENPVIVRLKQGLYEARLEYSGLETYFKVKGEEGQHVNF